MRLPVKDSVLSFEKVPQSMRLREPLIYYVFVIPAQTGILENQTDRLAQPLPSPEWRITHQSVY